MKQKVLLFVISALSLTLFSCGQETGPKKTSFEIKNGLNIMLSERITRADIEFIAHLGYDHLRINFQEQRLFDEAGQKIPEGFALLHNVLGWCEEFNLRAVVDLFMLRSHNHVAAGAKPLFTEAQAQEQFYECWRKLSGELKKYSLERVAYEPLNEPVADNHEDWNMVLNRCVEVIRELEPERIILMGSNEWSHWDTMKHLRVRENDPNIIITFHYYKPPLLTHYNSWLYRGNEIPVPVHYPGQTIADADLDAAGDHAIQGKMVYNIDVIERNFMEVMEHVQKYNLTIYCGEYGCFDGAPTEDRIRWMKDLYTLFERHGIPRAFWDYSKGGFGMMLKTGEPDTEMIDAMFGKKKVSLLRSY